MLKTEIIATFSTTYTRFALLWQRFRRDLLVQQQLTSADKRILYGLYGQEPMTKKELAENIVLEHSSLTRSLMRLIAKDMVTKTVNDQDKRAVLLQLTRKGQEKVEQYKAEVQKQWALFCIDIADDEIQQVTQFLQKACDAMDRELKTKR